MGLNDFQKALLADMVRVAKSASGVIAYSKLGALHGLSGDDEFNYNKLANELGTISEHEYESGRPLISVVVVRKDDKMPGLGFFKLANALGVMKHSVKSWENRVAFFAAEHKRTVKYWRKAK